MSKVYHVCLWSFLLLCIPCLGQPAAPEANAPPDNEQQPSAEGAQTEQAQVKLVEAGSSPRQTFRFQPKVGSKQSFVMLMNMQQKMVVGGNAMPTPVLPTQKFTIAVEVADVSTEGDIRSDWIYQDIEILDEGDTPKAVADKMRELMKPLAGMSGSVVVSNRGFTKKVNFEMPQGVEPQLRQMLSGMMDSMDKLSAPVPEEAIGAGAIWKVNQQVTANGLSLDQVATYKVVSIDKQGYHLDIGVEQVAKEQWINPPNLPPTTKIKLRSLDSSGTGTMTLASELLMPRDSDLDLKSDTAMQIVAGQQTQDMTTNMTMKMSIKSFPPGETAAE